MHAKTISVSSSLRAAAFSSALFGRKTPRRRNRRSSSSCCIPEAKNDSELSIKVERNEGVRDGVGWNERDEELVREAQRNTRRGSEEGKDAGASSSSSKSFFLLGKTGNELARFCEGQLDIPKWRATQMQEQIYKRRVKDVEEMRQLPRDLRAKMKTEFRAEVGRDVTHAVETAKDGTKKLLVRLRDDRIVETVGIPSQEYGKKRLTCCVSSQVGCPMRCEFCATGKGGFARNLSAREIVNQVLAIEEEFDGRHVNNVVFMGMGEPLMNVTNVVKAVKILNKELVIGARHITISTVGVFGGLEELALHNLQCTLAVSLHAPNQMIREKIIPSARAYSFDDLLTDCEAYFNATGRRVSFEYTLLSGVNDTKEHAKELGNVLYKRNLASHVNLIPFNPIDDADFKRPTKSSIDAFRKVLEEKVPTSVRQTRGQEASAACGQLRNEYQKKKMKPQAA